MIKSVLFSLLAALTLYINAHGQSIELPYYTGFDSPAERAGWQQFRKGFESSFDWGDNGSLSHDYNVGGDLTDTVIDWYVSPPLKFISEGQVSMKALSWGFSYDPFDDGCEVYAGTSNPDPDIGDFVLIGNLSYLDPDNMFIDTLFDIPLIHDSVYIAFKYKTIGAHWRIYNIDSITVEADSVSSTISQWVTATDIQLYPNPADESLFIKLKNESDKQYLFSIYNSAGRRIVQPQPLIADVATLTTSDWPEGVYVFQLDTAEGIRQTSRRFLVRH